MFVAESQDDIFCDILQVIANMEMNTELVCVMASIGYADGEDYFKSVDCFGMILYSLSLSLPNLDVVCMHSAGMA